MQTNTDITALTEQILDQYMRYSNEKCITMDQYLKVRQQAAQELTCTVQSGGVLTPAPVTQPPISTPTNGTRASDPPRRTPSPTPAPAVDENLPFTVVTPAASRSNTPPSVKNQKENAPKKNAGSFDELSALLSVQE